MVISVPDPMDAFETWFLRRVAEAVEAGDVPANLLTELQAQIEAAKDLPQEEGHSRSVQGHRGAAGDPVGGG
jgi:hypothetical protein